MDGANCSIDNEQQNTGAYTVTDYFLDCIVKAIITLEV